MKTTVLVDNVGSGQLMGEWGLSLHVCYGGTRILLDTGQSGLFVENAEKLGIDLSEVDAAVLSHAHYDHTNGLAEFLRLNSGAKVYLSPNAMDNCYGGVGFLSKYIGMPKGVVASFPSRIERPVGFAKILEGVYLVPHSTEGLKKLGRRNHLYIRKGFRYIPDDFAHEQTLVLDTEKGLVLMNSCSHSGPEVIVNEVQKYFPGKPITAYMGGLHLFRLRDEEVEKVADSLESCKIGQIYTGHCTGEKAYAILKKRFGERIAQFRCGMEIEL